MSFLSGILNKIYTQRDGHVPVLEDPAGNAINAQGNTSGHQYVETTASALPAGAATEATLLTRVAEATAQLILTAVGTRATEATLLLIRAALESLESALATDDAAIGTREAMPVAGVYLADPSADTLDNGDAGRLLVNVRRMLTVDLGTKLAGEDQERGNIRVNPGGSFVVIKAAGTNTISTGVGTLNRIVVTKAVAGSSITAYDNTAGSGTEILPTFGTTATELNSNVPHVVEVGASFTTGCTIVSVGNVEFVAIFQEV